MIFSLDTATVFLARTPAVLNALFRDIPDAWARQNEGPDTWSVFDVMGHLIHGERTDWMPRVRTILEHGPARTFERFDRFAQFEASKGKTLNGLLDEFAQLRAQSLVDLKLLQLTGKELTLQGTHPEFGPVTLEQLLSTWVAHDLDHLVQATRVMAKGYTDAVGPWKAYLRVLR